MPAPDRPQHAAKSLKSLHLGRQSITRTVRHLFRFSDAHQERAGLLFPVARIRRKLRKADIFLTAVLEYATAEMCELAGVECKRDKKKRITSRHIMMAVRGDDELSELLKNVTMPDSGVRPSIHESLLPKEQQRDQDTPEV